MLATYVSELHTSSLTQLCDRRICSLRLDEELTEAHLFASEKRPHAAPGCGLCSSCNRKTSRWRPRSSAHTPKKPESRIAARQRIGSLAWRQTSSVTNTTDTRSCYKLDMHKSRAPDRLTTTYCTAVPDICGSAVWDYLHVILLVPRILRWLSAVVDHLCTSASNHPE